MAISFPMGFELTCQEPIDSRFILTKEQMLEIKRAKMPSVYFCVCEEDGNLYLYNDTNEIDSETGRFRRFSADEFDVDEIS